MSVCDRRVGWAGLLQAQFRVTCEVRQARGSRIRESREKPGARLPGDPVLRLRWLRFGEAKLRTHGKFVLENNPVKMVDFVLNRARDHSSGLASYLLTAHIQTPNRNFSEARNRAVKPRQTQAALFLHRFASTFDDLRICERNNGIPVHDRDHSQWLADLWRRKSDSVRAYHRFFQVMHQLSNRRSDPINAATDPP